MTKSAAKTPRTKPRVSKQDWLHTALDLLKSGGIESVRVERLAEKLGVAKSGFYYHFRDRENLYAALLKYWIELDHAPMRAMDRLLDETPAERLAIISEIVDRKDLSRYDFAIRQWARQDPKVRRIWRTEMTKRIALLRDAFQQLGFEGDQLEMRTRLFVAYHTSERDLFSDLLAKDRARLRALRLELLLQP